MEQENKIIRNKKGRFVSGHFVPKEWIGEDKKKGTKDFMIKWHQENKETKEYKKRNKNISKSKIGKSRPDMLGNQFRNGNTPWNKKDLDENEIIKLYTEENKSASQISKIFNCCNSVIYRILKRNNVNIVGFKSHTREDRIKMSAKQQRIPIEQWKGYVTPLNHTIRTSTEYKNWIKEVLQNNNFTCLGCGQRGGDLEAHHIKPFREILRENNIKTFEEALNCKILWNIKNGITLCLKCHVQIDKYRHLSLINLNMEKN